MNNEAVAWMAVNELNGSYSTFTNDQKQRLLPHVSQCYGKWIPLYTHPVKEHFEDEPQAEELHEIMQSNAELTDEEIMGISGGENLSEQVFFWNKNAVLNFARAILRKASEK